jgi:hypothetical protein
MCLALDMTTANNNNSYRTLPMIRISWRKYVNISNTLITTDSTEHGGCVSENIINLTRQDS